MVLDMLIYHSRKYKLNEDFFSKWAPEMAYVLGFWFADGDMKHDKSYRIRFTSKDVEHLYLIREVVSSTNPVFQVKKYGRLENAFGLTFHSKKMYYDLSILGGKRNKSTYLVFPTVPTKFLPDYIRGYFDGDGSVHRITYMANKNGKTYTEIRSNFTCGTRMFIEKIRDLLSKEIGLTKRAIGQYGPHQFKLGYSQSDTVKLLRYIYYPSNPIFLKRKSNYLKIV